MNPLKLSRILQALAGLCHSDLGAERARTLAPAADIADAERRLDKIDEALALLRGHAGVPLAGRLTIADLLQAAQRGGVLDGLELTVLRRVARASAQLRAAAREWPREVLQLRHDAEGMPDLGLLAGLLDDSVDDDGLLLDTASPLLARLRADVLNLAARLRRRIADLVKETDEAGLLQDDYYTLRDDRYVLPVKSSDKRVLGGIIHGSSQTGMTVYVEPQEMVEGNNQLALAYDAVRREEHRILQELSGLCAEQADDLAESCQVQAGFDLAMAEARLAEQLAASRPSFSTDGSVGLRKARHPLLVLDGMGVVANDVDLRPPARWLVVSGPNGGGKTVVLSTLGLTAEMARLGLYVCTAPDSRVPWFDAVHVVLGDAQDIERGLSTFEGHLRAVQAALKAAANTPSASGSAQGGRVLVLLDELASGTEPIAGSALATAILESAGRSPHAWGAVTTHFEALKLLPLRDPVFVNAALELDPHTLVPTYRLKPGEMGSSSPLALAERIGLDPAIVERASQLAGGGGSEVAQVLDRLARERQLLQDRLTEVEKQQLQLDRSRAMLDDQRLNEQRAADRRIERAAEQAMIELAAVQRDLEAAKRAVRSGDKQTVDEASRLMTARQVQVQKLKERAEGAQHAPQRQPLAEAALVPDTQVWHEGLGRIVTITSFEARSRRVRVRAGLLDAWANIDELRRPLPADPGYKAPPKPLVAKPGAYVPPPRPPEPAQVQEGAAAREVDDETFLLRTPERTVDLRGMRVEEALAEVDRLLDRAVVENAPGVCIVHGLGTGAVREGVRKHLKKHSQVARFRAGIRGEGGDGATLVWVRQ